LLLAKCQADPRYQREEALRATIIIDPRPEAREKPAGGYHRRGERGTKVEAYLHQPHPNDTTEERRISSRVAAYKAPEGETLGWCCPGCGPLTLRETPLAGEDNAWHCPRVGCDAVVRIAATT